MEIVAALFIDNIETRQDVAGGPTKIDLTGVAFSATAPTEPPVVVEPHLVVLIRCAPGDDPSGVLEVRFLRERRDDGEPEQIARNAQPVQVEPGKFAFRLVRAGLSFDEYGTVEAHCRIGGSGGHVTVVPYTLVPDPTR